MNGLSGLFETVDDQFEQIREERDAYLAGIRESTSSPDVFLENELNLDSFREYLTWAFPNREVESWDGQTRMALDGLLQAGYKTLGDVNQIVKQTAGTREALIKEMDSALGIRKCTDGTLPSVLEAVTAVVLTMSDWEELVTAEPRFKEFIRNYLADHKSAG